MYLLRLHRALAKTWRGKQYVRGRIYEVTDHGAFLEMLGTGHFQEAGYEGVARSVTGPRPEVVVIRDHGLGDVVMALAPALEFARLNPWLRVSFATTPAFVDLVRAQPGFERVYDIAEIPAGVSRIDLRGYVERHHERRRIPRQQIFAEAFGLSAEKVSAGRRGLQVQQAWADNWRQLLGNANDARRVPIVALAARASSGIRTLDPPVVRDIAHGLVSLGAVVAVADAPEVVEDIPGVVTSRSSLITLLAGLVSLADLVISPDSGLLHLGAAAGKPVIGLFTTLPSKLRMHGYEGIAIEPENIPCFPCMDRGCPPHPCTAAIRSADVVSAAARILSTKFALAPNANADRSFPRQIVYGNPFKEADNASIDSTARPDVRRPLKFASTRA